jgi:hypothetical protein
MKPWEIQQIEGLYRQAVQLYVNPAGGPAPCELGCGRLGTDAHHAINRSQEPGVRWKWEPIWGLWVCKVCHHHAHIAPWEFFPRAIARLKTIRPQKARTLILYSERHDRLRCPDVSFEWLREYLRRRIAGLQKDWSRAYCCDL